MTEQPDDPRMLIPDLIAVLTRERDEARADRDQARRILARHIEANTALTRQLVMARESVAWFERECDRLDSVRLAADQQHANEPECDWVLERAMAGLPPAAGARDVTADPDLCPFLDPDAPTCSTGHVMPARAYWGPNKQAVGLLR